MGVTGAEFALLSLTVGVGAVLQVSVGFGLGMIAAPVFSLVDPTLAPPVVLLLAAGVTAAVLLRERGSADLRGRPKPLVYLPLLLGVGQARARGPRGGRAAAGARR